MRDNVVPCGSGFPDLAIPSLKELDLGIEVVAVNGTRAPDSHDRRQFTISNNPLPSSRAVVLSRSDRNKSCPTRGTHIDREATSPASILPDGYAVHRSEWHTYSCLNAAPGNERAGLIMDADGSLAK
jgi:hypothetical protein